jgi:hypothetical protein
MLFDPIAKPTTISMMSGVVSDKIPILRRARLPVYSKSRPGMRMGVAKCWFVFERKTGER